MGKMLRFKGKQWVKAKRRRKKGWNFIPASKK